MRMSILHAALFTPMSGGHWGLPLLLQDEPGTGKTSVVREYANKVGLPCRVLSPGTDGEGAFGCVPVPVNGRLTYPAPDWTDAMADGGIVVCDEVTTAPPMIQTSIMGILTERRIGSHRFGPRVRTLGICNPVELAANGYDIAPPLANRFGHLTWGAPTAAEHTAYMLGKAADDEAVISDSRVEERRVLAAWPEAFARAVGLETSFLSAQEDWKNKCPRAGDPAASRAWPSDRTWEYATRALAAAAVHGLSEVDRDDLLTAFIGPTAYAAFSVYVQNADLPNVADVLDGRITWKHVPSRLDRTAALLNSCTALIASPKAEHRNGRADVLWAILGQVSATAGDIIVPVVRALIDANLHSRKAALPVLASVQPVLAAAGVKWSA